jgi:hypothetical protein
LRIPSLGSVPSLNSKAVRLILHSRETDHTCCSFSGTSSLFSPRRHSSYVFASGSSSRSCSTRCRMNNQMLTDTPSPLQSQSIGMCQVTRVKNRCGHVNDHVEMVCHHAKPMSTPGKSGDVLADRANNTALTRPPCYPDPMKLARPISVRHFA